MKRTLSTILAIVMLLSVCSSLTFTASATVTEEEAKVTYEIKTNGLKNGEITFDVYLAPNQTITSTLITIKYDTEVFEFVEAGVDSDEDGNALVPGLHEAGFPNSGENKEFYTFTSLLEQKVSKNVNGQQVVELVPFVVKNNPRKLYTITFKVKSGKLGAVTGIDFYKGSYEDCKDAQNLIKNYSNFVALETPVIKSYWLEDGALGFSWNSVTGAAGGYMVYKKIGNDFVNLTPGGIAATSYKDSSNLTNGTTYTYAVVSRDGIYGYPSMQYEFNITYVAPPTVTVSNASNGVNIKWTKVSSADKYLVYRSALQNDAWSSWETVGTANSTKLTYIDSTAQKGVNYRYAVSAVIDGVETGYKASASIQFVSSQPTLEIPVVKVANASNGIKVTWNKIKNAESYIVYTKTYDAKNKSWSGWKNRGTLTSTSWIDKKAKSGTNYKYTVRAVNGSVKSEYKSSSSILYLAQPAVKIANAATGIKVNWSKVAGATGYTVYRSEYKNGSWTKWASRGTAKANKTSWTDKKVKSGVQYKYTVRAINGKVASAYVSSNKVLYLAQPTTTVKAVSNGIKVSWTQSAGAKGYTVYRSEYNTKTKKWSGWANMGTAKKDKKSWVDKKAKKGVKYKYTVRAINGSYKSTYVASGSVKR